MTDVVINDESKRKPGRPREPDSLVGRLSIQPVLGCVCEGAVIETMGTDATVVKEIKDRLGVKIRQAANRAAKNTGHTFSTTTVSQLNTNGQMFIVVTAYRTA